MVYKINTLYFFFGFFFMYRVYKMNLKLANNFELSESPSQIIFLLIITKAKKKRSIKSIALYYFSTVKEEKIEI